MNSKSIASNKYNKENTIAYCIRLNRKTDADLIDFMESLDNKTGFVKECIRTCIQEER